MEPECWYLNSGLKDEKKVSNARVGLRESQEEDRAGAKAIRWKGFGVQGDLKEDQLAGAKRKEGILAHDEGQEVDGSRPCRQKKIFMSSTMGSQ